jgi:hypothetical protein
LSITSPSLTHYFKDALASAEKISIGKIKLGGNAIRENEKLNHGANSVIALINKQHQTVCLFVQ